MTPQEAGQRIRASRDAIECVYATCSHTCGTADQLAFDELGKLHPDLAWMICRTKDRWVGNLPPTNRNVQSFSQGNATMLIDFVANEVEKQLSLQAALEAPSPPIVTEPDTLEVVQERTAIALLNRLAKAADDGTGEHELRQISEAYLNVTKEGVESSDRPNAAQLGALLMRVEGLRAAQNVLQKAGLDIRQHPANAVQILVDQRDEARKIAAEIGAERDSRVTEANATISMLETELVKAKEAASNRESTAATHVFLDTLRIPDGKLRDRLQCLEAVRNRLDNAGFTTDDISLAVRYALTVAGTAKELATDAAKSQIATDQANFRYEGARNMLDELGKRLFDRYFEGRLSHKEWPKTHADDFAHVTNTFQAVPGDVRAQFAAMLTLVRHLANSEKIENSQASSTCAKLRNDIATAHQYLDKLHIQGGTILERVEVIGIIRDTLAKDGFVSYNLPGLVETVLESLRDAQKERDALASKLDEIQTLLVSNGFVAESVESPQFAVHGVTWLLDALSETQKERDDATAEVARLKGLALVNDVSAMHKLLDDAAVPAGHIVNRVRSLAAMATNLHAELDAANEQTSLQSRTIRNLAELLDANVTSKNLVSLVKGLRKLNTTWQLNTGTWLWAADALEARIKESLGERYDAVIAAAKASEKPIGHALHDAAKDEFVALELTPHGVEVLLRGVATG